MDRMDRMKTKAWISLFYPVHPVHPCSNFAFLMMICIMIKSQDVSGVRVKPAYTMLATPSDRYKNDKYALATDKPEGHRWENSSMVSIHNLNLSVLICVHLWRQRI